MDIQKMKQDTKVEAIDNIGLTLRLDKEFTQRKSQFRCANWRKLIENKHSIKKFLFCKTSFTVTLCVHYVTLTIIGISTWGLLWCAYGDNWRWDGQWFRLAIVAITAWLSGQILQKLTTLPPLLAALLIGILAGNLGILEMREYISIDLFLRKVYPVVILGKASLGWDTNYMKNNWQQITALGVLPWVMEVITVCITTHWLLNFPWIWGLLLGSIYASVSCAVVIPSLKKHDKENARNWTQLVCTAGGIDTALSVGVYGLIYSFMFYNTIEIYRYIKAAMTLFAGVIVGITWGLLAALAPHPLDYYVAELRILIVLIGGLFVNFVTTFLEWNGVGGVAVLVCNATAAKYWSQSGWKLNNNPASTAYRVLWSALEPILFAYTGTFFVINKDMPETMVMGFGVLLICLTVRLITTCLICRDFSLKERIFVCCTWIPKSIVEAVLCPVALGTLISNNVYSGHEVDCAEKFMRLIVQAILITTPIGYLLTNHLGPILLKRTRKDEEARYNSYI